MPAGIQCSTRMRDLMEKRTSKRHTIDTSVVCSYLTAGQRDKTFNGKMRNYCSRGMYAELNGQLQKGLILVIKTRPAPKDSARSVIEEGFRSVSLAQVQWSKPMSHHGDTLYGTGLKYL
jgi:hypothetical protein